MTIAQREMAVCAGRLRALGLEIVSISKLKGPFAADIYEIEAAQPGKAPQRLIYKLPPEDRLGELETLDHLGEALKPWLPEGIVLYSDPPRAILSRYAGEPLQPALAEASGKKGEAQRRRWYERVLAVLADMHLATFPRAAQWVREGKVRPYAYSAEWAERMLEDASGVFPPDEIRRLERLVHGFYRSFSAERMRGPQTFTHGDPHPGNVLVCGEKLTLVDWEWTNVASPMRDAAILALDEPDDRLFLEAGRILARFLLAGGLSADEEDLMHDFCWMAADNALMMLGWDVTLHLRGDLAPEELKVRAKRRVARAEVCWSLAEH